MARKKAPRRTRSATEVEQLNQSFSYEAGTLVSQGLLYLRGGEQLSQDGDLYPAADALFDALLNRLRALDAFFRNRATRDTDAIAEDTVPDWKPRPILHPTDRQKINVRLSHITYLRPPQHEWEIGVMVRAALEAIGDFMERAGVKGRKVWDHRRREVATTLAEWRDLDEVRTENDRHAYR